VIIEAAPEALRRALEAAAPGAVAFATRQLAHSQFGLEGAAWSECHPDGAEPPAAEIALGNLLWDGDL
jgi:hypothetical protein